MTVKWLAFCVRAYWWNAGHTLRLAARYRAAWQNADYIGMLVLLLDIVASLAAWRVFRLCIPRALRDALDADNVLELSRETAVRLFQSDGIDHAAYYRWAVAELAKRGEVRPHECYECCRPVDKGALICPHCDAYLGYFV